ncbi:hypothetical protein B0H12DRAFT_387032 [Mycena haematopus]|nr:hypothetical protein B0H12DRAFT_387032 [Mycena haematopus]
MCRHKFKISQTKAEQVLKHGQLLMRSKNAVASKEPKLEEDEVSALAPSTSARTSHRIPVPCVRKEPTGITTSIEPPILGRPPKRTVLSGPPRADRKRRKVLDPEFEFDELQSEEKPEFESASAFNPGNGREILPAPQFGQELPDATGSVPVEKPAPTKSHEHTSTVRARRPDNRALISARLTQTEKRLDALEARLRKTELGLATRQHVVSELNGTIGELEGNSDVQSAAGRLRALHASLLDEEADSVSAGGVWDPNDEVLIDDEQDGQEHGVAPDGVVEDLEGGATAPNGDTSILVENNEPPILDAITVDAPTGVVAVVLDDDTSILVDDNEPPILDHDPVIAADAASAAA